MALQKSISFSESERFALRTIALRDTFFFSKVVMGFKDLEIEPHLAMAEFLDRQDWTRRMLLAPRGTLKSTLGRALEIQMAMRNPNIRILHVMSSAAVAAKASRQIDGIFRNNTMLRFLFPDRIPDFNSKAATWSLENKTIRRTKDYPEPTFMYCGVGTKVTGLHFDVIILDDFIELEAAQSKEVMNSCIEYAAQCEPLLEKHDSQMIVIGTLWALDDYYSMTAGRSLKTTKKLFQADGDTRFMVMRRRAIEDGGPFWPQRFPEEEIAKIKASFEAKGQRALFFLNYMNNPIDEALCEFPQSRIRHYRWNQNETAFILNIPDKPVRIVSLGSLRLTMTVDPAFRSGKRFDESAIAIVGSHPEGYRINLDSWTGQVTPDILVTKIIELFIKWRKRGKEIAKVGIEKVAGQRAISYFLADRCKYLGIYIPITYDLKTDTHKSKEDRIRGLIGTVAEGMWFTHERFVRQNEEMELFPNGTKLNWLDALSYQPQIWGLPDYPTQLEIDDGWDDEDITKRSEETREAGYGS